MSFARLPLLVAVVAFFAFPLLASAQSPTIVAVSPVASPTVGGDTITINGTDFGRSSGVVTLGGSLSEIVSWAETQVRARIPEGDPGQAELIVVDETGVASAPFLFDYEGPNLVAVTPTEAPATGGVLLTITGENFGRASASRSWSVDGVPSEETSWLGHDRVTIVMPRLQSGGIKPIRLEIAGFASEFSGLEATVPQPVIDFVEATSAPTAGGERITIHGTDFGTRGATSQVTVGGATAEPTSWTDVEIVAALPEGDPGPTDVVVVSEFGVASTPSIFSYDAPVLLAISPTSAPQGGGVRLTITGENFGRSTAQRSWSVDGVPAQETAWLGHGRATIDMPPVSSAGLKPVRLVSASIASNDVLLEVTADAPSIVSITPASGPTRGGTTITLNGRNFGLAPGAVTICGSTSELTSWTSDQVVATTPECWSGLQPLVLTTADARQTEWNFGYDPPVVTGVTSTALPAVGGGTITIVGENFGTAAAPRLVSVDGQLAEPVAWRGHDEIVVSSPPVLPGKTVPVCVAVGSEAPACGSAVTDPILVTVVDPATGPRSGGISLTIRGQNFGVDPATPRTVRFGANAATDLTWLDDGRLSVTVPAAADDGPVDVSVSVAAATATFPSGFTYETSTSVEGVPTSFALHANAPNPFSSRTAFSMDLPRSTTYRLKVFDVRGRLAREVVDRAGPGRIIVHWDGTDAEGARLASGIYFYRLETDGFVQTRRMVLMR